MNTIKLPGRTSIRLGYASPVEVEVFAESGDEVVVIMPDGSVETLNRNEVE